jgi:hypothetical protein
MTGKEMKLKPKKTLYWVPRTLLLAYAVFAAAYAITDSWGKEINASGLGMLLILAIFGGGLIYIAWTAPKKGGPILALFGIFSILIGFTYHDYIDWNSVYFNGLPLAIIGGWLTLEGFRLIPAQK